MPLLTMVLAAVSVVGLGAEAWVLRRQQTLAPSIWRLTWVVRKLVPRGTTKPTLLIFTMHACGGCAPAELWRLEWENTTAPSRVGVHFVTVGDGDIVMDPAELAKTGLKTIPSLVVVDVDRRVRSVTSPFRRDAWNEQLSAAMRSI